MNEITVQRLQAMMLAISERISAQAESLNRLDSALGDGDHGTGISTAFAFAVQSIDTLEEPSLGDVWLTAARALMNRMGGASGALFGTFFLKGVGIAKGKDSLNKADMDSILQAGLAGVKGRGKAEVGDKTMVDALEPAVEAFCAGETYSVAWQKAAAAAWQGAESTVNMLARHGRAKFIGERAVGHQDAGATTIALIFEAIREYWEVIEGE